MHTHTSGVKKMDHGIPLNAYSVGWGVGVPLVYAVTAIAFRASKLCPGYGRKGSELSDMIAYEFVSFACSLYVALAGVAVVTMFGLTVWQDLSDKPFYGQSVNY